MNSFLPLLLVQNAGSANLNPWDLVLQAGLIVQGVMILLLLASILSWTIIFWKWYLLRNAAVENQAFAESFWASGSLEGAMRASKAHPSASLTRVFETGMNEFNQVIELDLGRDEKVELLETNVARSLEKASKAEADKFKLYLPFLANCSSAAPFIGLFGTVWGIMNSFIGIGATGASNLAVVAPGIAEALIATAMGLFAAIPAVLFYNFFTSKVRSLSAQMSHFSTDFLNTAKRNL